MIACRWQRSRRIPSYARNELSSHLKIVHGAADGYYGLFGSGVRISHSFMLPGFDAMLGRLSRLAFGQIEEYAPHELPVRKSHS
jgi:hypothetical protein